MLYHPRQFVLNLLGLTALLIVIGGLANSLFGFGRVGLVIVFLVPHIAARLEGLHAVHVHGLRPGKQAMWHVSRQMTPIYVQIAALILLLFVIPMSGSPDTPDVLSPIAFFAIGMVFTFFTALCCSSCAPDNGRGSEMAKSLSGGAAYEYRRLAV